MTVLHRTGLVHRNAIPRPESFVGGCQSKYQELYDDILSLDDDGALKVETSSNADASTLGSTIGSWNKLRGGKNQFRVQQRGKCIYISRKRPVYVEGT